MKLYKREAYGIKFPVLEQNVLPPKPYDALNFAGFIWVRNIDVLTENVMRHEAIHTIQARALWYVPYYVWYVSEYLIRLVYCMNHGLAYSNISFEREAYENEEKIEYKNERKRFDFLKYI